MYFDTLLLILFLVTCSNLHTEVEVKLTKRAYMCICSSPSFVLQSIHLFFQLKRFSSKKGVYVILYTGRDLDEEYLKVINFFGIQVEKCAAKSEMIKTRDDALKSKLLVWTMEKYDCIVLLDTDMLVRSNIDELFDLNYLMSAVPCIHDKEKIVFHDPDPSWDLLKETKEIEDLIPVNVLNDSIFNLKKITSLKVHHTGLNAGVMVLKPSMYIYEELVKISKTISQRLCCPIQELLYRYFESRGAYHRLHWVYNCRHFNYLTPSEKLEAVENSKIYHFVERKKPFCSAFRDEDLFHQEWWASFDELWTKICNLYMTRKTASFASKLNSLHEMNWLKVEDNCE